jgi:hypothetical protein
MRYLLFIGRDRRIAISPDDRIGDRTEVWVNEMDGRGVRLQGHVLAESEDATTVRVREDEVARRRRSARPSETSGAASSPPSPGSPGISSSPRIARRTRSSRRCGHGRAPVCPSAPARG